MSEQRLVVLLSGGIESIVTAAIAAQTRATRHALYVDYGHLARVPEKSAARAISREYGLNLEVVELTLPFLETHDMFAEGAVIIANEELPEAERIDQAKANRAHAIPHRNLVFVGLATMLAETVGATEVWAGFDDNPASPTRTKDKSPEFAELLGSAIRAGSDASFPNIPRIITPLQGNSKTDTIQLGQSLGVKWSLSRSCYNGFTLPCGVCAQCRTRRAAFAKLGVDEGVAYCSREFIDAQVS